MRAGRAAATLVATAAGLFALFAAIAWNQTAWLPYNSEGRWFDASAEVVFTDAEPAFWAVMGCTASVVALGAGLVRWKLRRR